MMIAGEEGRAQGVCAFLLDVKMPFRDFLQHNNPWNNRMVVWFAYTLSLLYCHLDHSFPFLNITYTYAPPKRGLSFYICINKFNLLFDTRFRHQIFVAIEKIYETFITTGDVRFICRNLCEISNYYMNNVADHRNLCSIS